MIFLSFIISSHLILPICFKIAPLTFFFHSISYIFFHCHMDRDHLDTLSSLLQSHLFFLSPLSQNILHRSVCHKIPLLQADYFLLTDYLQLPISVSLILSLPFNLPLQNTSSFAVIYTRNFLHKNIAIYKYLCITRYL